MSNRSTVRPGAALRVPSPACPRTRLYDAIASGLQAPPTISARATRLLGLGAALLLAGPAMAAPDLALQPSSLDAKGTVPCSATFVVSTTSDAGPGSLREAVVLANGCAGPNTVDASGISGTIALASGQLAIYDALADANPGDGDITIVGPGAAALTIDAQYGSRIFHIDGADAAISGLTLTNGLTTSGSDGGAIYVYSESVAAPNTIVLTGLTISNSYASTDGGGISVQNGADLTIQDSTITGNDSGYGGGVHMYSYTADHDLTLVNSSITDNTAYSSSGGGVTFYGFGNEQGTLTITDSYIARNQSGSDGGGVFFYSYVNGVLDVSGTTFAGNVAYYNGGGIFAYGDNPTVLTVADSSFEGNTAQYGDGGGLAVYGNMKYGSLLVTDTAFDQNSAPGGYGGGLSVRGALDEVTVQGAIFTGNDAGFGGGMALALDDHPGPQPVLLQDTVLSGNSTGEFGGGGIAIFSTADAFALDGVTLQDNIAYGGGGGLTFYAGSGQAMGSLTIANSSVTGNQAQYGNGGGLEIRPYSSTGISITGTSISGNATSNYYDGGGISLDAFGLSATDMAVSASTISGNSAGNGGGMELFSGGLLAIENSTISGNSADYDGGGLQVDGALTLTLSTVVDNAASYGGGIDVDGGTTTLRNAIIGNNAASYGPDIYGAVDADFTLVEDATGAVVTGANNILGSDPQLGPLADNGGPTLTHLPLPGSPVVNAGDPGFAPPPATDQRGAGFPRVNTVVDLGAVEAPPQVTALAIAPDPFAEGSTATLTVSLDGTAGADVLVTVDFTGTALAGTDFTPADDAAAVPGVQVLVAAGSASGDITLAASADGVDEPDEPFTATASAATGASIAGSVQDTATIGDADPTPSIAVADASASEVAGTLSFGITLSNPSSQLVTVDFATADGTALAGQDFTAATGTVSFAAGEVAQDVVVTLANDGLDEPSETFLLQLSNASASAVLGDAQATGTILDSSALPSVSLSLSLGTLPSETGSADIVVSLDAVSGQDVLVTLLLSGTASQGVDYVIGDDDPLTPGVQVTIPAGQASGSVTLTALDDGVDEGDETVVVDINAVGNGQEAGVQQATLVIPGSGAVPPPAVPQAVIIPTLSEWMLLLLGLLLPATVVARLRRRGGLPRS